MPGWEIEEPLRTDNSSGLLGLPKFLTVVFSSLPMFRATYCLRFSVAGG